VKSSGPGTGAARRAAQRPAARHHAGHRHPGGQRDERQLISQQLGGLGDVGDHLAGQPGSPVQVPAAPALERQLRGTDEARSSPRVRTRVPPVRMPHVARRSGSLGRVRAATLGCHIDALGGAGCGAEGRVRAEIWPPRGGVAAVSAAQPLPSPGPHPLPRLDALALAAVHVPRAGGTGDWYDGAALDDGRLALAVGDGVGPGWLRRVLAEGREPDPAASALVVTVDAGTGLLHWWAAGHPPPLLVGPDGARVLAGDAPPAEALAPGGTLVLATRGLLGSPDALDRLAAAAAPLHGLGPHALAAALLRSLLDGGQPADDAGLVAARRMPVPLEERLPADPRRLVAVRRSVTRWCGLAALSDDATADLQLLLSEAATNAVEHAYREVEPGEFVYSLRRRGDGTVRVIVQDFGRWRPPPADPGYRGRGLALINNLATGVALDVAEGGTRIAFTVPADSADAADPADPTASTAGACR
jgi:anti-sigma regulatory factor (Ser/Thr protein kinase)